ncbi:M36 family metallopeptidase [Hymenobacter ruricola]|uniref:M36 family metallopeptidase n=1 Tax=Hymenobacter ruricola TaxID=2791023 RepID=A0ABS0I3N5_9BACT|nr:M36 family metallopeptidase [Hymenobacter ruricola]MBF9221551.1 M36 family metallopeptidase [Hymenobacter ruricola]
MRNLYAHCLVATGLLAVAWQPARAQSEAARQATELAWQTRQQWANSDVAQKDLRISSAHAEAAGILYAYPQQLQDGIPVYNQVVTLVFKGGKLANHAGSFVPAKAFAGLSAVPQVPAATAVATAIAALPGHPDARPAAQESPNGPDQQQRFAPAGVARRPIVARLVWAKDKNQRPHLAWNVNVDVLASADWLNIRVDATTGQVLDQDNWTVSEKAAHPAAAPGRQATASARPQAPFLRRPSGAKGILAVTPASYIVVPFPGERPDVTTPTTETNPWLRAGAGNAATTHGWHFDGTTNYTDTRGNNVWAYDDSLKQNAPGRLVTSTGTAGSLVFNDVPNFSAKPTLGRNRRAATVNLFYWNNLMHDVMYQYGFNEASANFQTDNIGRGGVGADHVRAEAQDGLGLNNANFNTPPDGTSGRMQMYLFNPVTSNTLVVTAPAAIARTYTMAEGAFSTQNLLANKGPVSGTLAYYTDPGAGTHIACTSPSSTSVSGKIALIYRGSCNYVVKVKAAQNEGAIAVVMVNNAPGPPVTMGGTDNTVVIPAVMVSQADGATLAGQLNAGATVQLTLNAPLQLDGDFDSGIMAHEYGHGISNRLTGGGPNVSCLGNAEQAGEGWSDFFALMMTTDWTATPLTDGPRARPMGTYVQGQATSGSGIRRYPYSTSLAVNPLTYADMAASTEVHNIGEIWAATLWDMTWNIIQQQSSIEPNLYNSASTGGNAVALQLVMQGLKMQPCEPGYLDGRDAILAADSLLYGGRYHCAIWGAFARRGMGYSAREGSSNSATDQTAAYDLPGVRLRRRSTPLVGNQFAINLAATCECQTQTPVTITDELPAGLQYISSTGGTLSGSTVTFPALSFATGQQRNFQIVAQTAAGAGCAVTMPVNDDREANTVGGFTPAVVAGGASNAWAPSTTRAHSGTAAWRAGDPDAASDVTLTSAAFTPGAFSVLSFYHYFNSEARYDGGLVAISVNNGAWQDAGALFLQNGYNNTFDSGTASSGKPCFSGKSSGLEGTAAFQQSLVNLASFSGQSIRVRFQFQSDSNNPSANALPGWFVDDIQVMSGCGGLQQVQLLNSAGALTGSYAQATFLTPLAVPVITLLNPNSGPVGTSVIVTGTDLANATGLTLNGATIALSNVTANTATSLTFTLPAGATTGLLTVATAGGTSNGLTFTVLPAINTWTGALSTDWNTAGNWTNGLPTATTDALIPGNVTNMPAIASATADVRNLTLNAGATLSQTAGTLNVLGNLTNNGTFRPTGGTVVLGTTFQTNGPNLLGSAAVRFWDLTVNPNGVLLSTSAGASVQHLLTLNGAFVTQGNTFTLESNATNTALVVNNAGGFVFGAATVQRYIDPSQNPNRGYRHVSAPVGTATVASLTTSTFTPVVNPAYNTVGNTVTTFPTVFGYDQTRLATAATPAAAFDKGWYSPGALTDPLAVGRGYTVNLAANQTWNFTGALTNGDVTQTLARNAGATAADAGLHLVGNPYPAPLDWSRVAAADRPNVDGVMYVFTSDDPANPYAGTYRFYQVNPGGDFGTVSPVLPLGKAFFVRVTPGQTSGTLAFKNAHRVTSFAAPVPVFQRPADARPAAHLTLRAAAGSAPTDDAFVYFDGAATDGFDAAYDAEKLANPSGLNLSSSGTATPRLCVNGLAPLTATQRVVPLAVGVPAAGSYTLNAAELRNLGSTPTYLRDLQTGAVVDLAQQPSYSFTVSNAAALITGRFELVFSPQAVLATAPAALAAQVGLYPNPASTAVTVELPALLGRKAVTAGLVDALGRVVRTQVLPAGLAIHTLPLTGLATGVYSLRLQTDVGVIVKKLVVE